MGVEVGLGQEFEEIDLGGGAAGVEGVAVVALARGCAGGDATSESGSEGGKCRVRSACEAGGASVPQASGASAGVDE